MKKKIFAIAMMVACLAILTSTTLAYFTTSDVARNVITSGGIKVALVEQQKVGEDLLPYPNEPIEIMPGESVSKIVTVQGLDESAWIRMRFDVTVLDAEGAPMNVTAEEIAALVQIPCDSGNWTYDSGWWYCNKVLTRGESTAPLFETVDFSTTMGNAYQSSTIYLDVKVEAVQSANNGSTALNAAGWPSYEE